MEKQVKNVFRSVKCLKSLKVCNLLLPEGADRENDKDTRVHF